MKNEAIADACKGRANELAAFLGISREKIEKALVPTVSHCLDAEGPYQPDPVQALDLACRALYEALHGVDANRQDVILSKFEIETSQILERSRAYEYLSDASAPLYTLAELADLTDRLLEHLTHFQDETAMYGCPTAFADSAYLDGLLRPLYLVRRWGYIVVDRTALGMRPVTVHSWVKDVAGRPQLCGTYEEADLLPGIRPEDAELADRERYRLVQPKLEIIPRLARAVRAQAASADLWGECFPILARSLDHEAAQKFLSLDTRFLGFDLATGQLVASQRLRRTGGGLTELVLAIGHYQAELSIGGFHQMAPVFKDMAGKLSGRTYFELMSAPWFPGFERAIDAFLEREQQTGALRSRLFQRASHDFENELDVQVNFTFVLPKGQSETFRQALAPLAEYFKVTLQRTGQLPQLILSSAATAGNIFKREGSQWQLRFANQEAWIAHLEGLEDIAFLLAHPNQDFSVLAWPLEAAPNPSTNLAAVQELSRQSEPLGIPSLDAAAFEAYRRRLRELQAQIEEAQAVGDDDALEKARWEQEYIQHEISEAQRHESPALHRARNRIAGRIDRAIKSIVQVHPMLAEHLDATISTGRLISYRPSQPVEWLIK